MENWRKIIARCDEENFVATDQWLPWQIEEMRGQRAAPLAINRIQK